MSILFPGFRRLFLLTGLLRTFPLFGAADTPNPGLKYYYPAPDAPVVDIAADIVVYGGTSGGVTAAVQAARLRKSVVLVVFGRHVGGLTSGGLTQTDGVNASVQGGITREFFSATGNSGFKPSKAEQEFEKLLADPVPGENWDSPVQVYYEQRLDTVEKTGVHITALHMENGSVFRGKVFIDCSYEGDLMARSGVSYTYGKESTDQYNESRAGRKNPVPLPGVDAYKIPGDADSGLIYNLLDEAQGTSGQGYSQIQAYNFRMYTVQNADPSTRQPLFAPQNYDPSQFEILYRYHRSGGSTVMTVGNDINNHEMFNRGCSTDHIGGNRWPDGNGGWISWADADYATRELIYQSHVSWQLGMLWYLKTDSQYRDLVNDLTLSVTIRDNIQNLLDKVDQLGFPQNEYPETGGWPHELYVREARRMVSDFVLTQDYYDHRLTVSDAVGLANYSSDSHHVRRFAGPDGMVWVEGDTGGGSISPWRLPYRALIPPASECDNLLVPWAISASSVAFASMRMEPCFMVLSQSASTAASLCIERGETVQELPYELLRLHLIADGQILGEETELENGIIIDNRDSERFSLFGPWTESTSTSGFYGGDYLHDNQTGSGMSASFSPDIETSGEYEVFARWTAHANRASNASIDILHQGEVTTVQVNQQVNGGVWYSLGSYNFDAGKKTRVTLRNDGADGYVIADAVKFVSTATPPPLPQVHLLTAGSVADEQNALPALIRIIRESEDLSHSLTVSLEVGGSAVSGSDYLPLPDQVTIPANAQSVSFKLSPIPNDQANGNRNVILTLVAQAAYEISGTGSTTLTLRDKPYDAWRHRHFSAAGQENSALSVPDADFDGDGLLNEVEFILRTDPDNASKVDLPKIRIAENDLIFEYWCRSPSTGYQVSPQSSEALMLGIWNNPGGSLETIQYDPDSDSRLMRLRFDLTSLSNLLLRLKIERVP